MGKANILIAEDDPDIASDLKSRLTGLDYHVQGPTSLGCGAVAIAKRLIPDLVLMDIQLRGDIDGIQAAQKLRELHVPVVFVTGHSGGSVFDRAKLVEPGGYLLKPYDDSTLKIAIELALYKHRTEQERRRLSQRLDDMARQGKLLTGRVSICSYCKKAKDDQDEWEQIELYIMKRTGLSFTHGVCPHCFDELKRKLELLDAGQLPSGSLVIG